jgi:hypothetical protein
VTTLAIAATCAAHLWLIPHGSAAGLAVAVIVMAAVSDWLRR